MARRRFDAQAFWRSLDAARAARQITWGTVAAEVDVPAPVISRMKHGHSPAADSLLALLGWLGACPEVFLVPASHIRDQEPIVTALAAFASDDRLTEEGMNTLRTVLLATYEAVALPAPASGPDQPLAHV
ncbi:hypothetical protein [Saccharothrix hoggarensis]|uniref:Helix-turn-helix protein n=1 Tax=Saccharothrix hoggarensis TaxID=913853 RepID=A0ABW3QKJ6_9PSEU